MLYDMTVLTEQVAAKVRAKAAERKVSQKDISLKTGIALSTLNRRMAGTSPWNTDELASVANVLGCRPGELIPSSTQDAAVAA